MHNFDHFLELCPDLLIVAGSLALPLKRVNPSACSALGWSEAELLSRTFLELTHPDDRDEVAAAATAMAGGDANARLEHRMLRKDGGYLWTEWKSGYFPDEGLFYGIGRDITERKQAEAALAAAQAERNAVLESIGDAFYSVDSEWRITYANARAAELLNHPLDAMLGQLLGQLNPKEKRVDPAQIAVFERTMADRQQRGTEYFSKSAGRWVSARIYPRDDGGLSVYFGDISDRKRMEEALRASQAHFEAVVNLVPDLLWRSDPDGKPTWSNQSWLNYHGTPLEALPNGGWHLLLPDELERVRASFEAGHRNKGPITSEYRIRRSDGVHRWFLVRVQPVLGSDGSISSWYGNATDIDDLKRSQGRQELLIAELQHRTRNLLGIVRAVASQTIGGSTSLDDFGERFNSRLGALSRVQTFLSHSLAIGVRELLHAELAAHGIDPGEPRVILEGPPAELPSGSVQPLALGLHELTTNALKHGAFATPSGCLAVRWWVDTDTERPCLRLEWRESGVEISDRDKPTRRGFGFDLIERGLPYQLGATTEVTFSTDGLVCNLALSLAAAGPGAKQASPHFALTPPAAPIRSQPPHDRHSPALRHVG